MAQCAVCAKDKARTRDFKVEGQVFNVCWPCKKELGGDPNVIEKIRVIHFGIDEQGNRSSANTEPFNLIPMVTTPRIEGKEIEEYHGIVAAQAVEGINIFKDFVGGLRNLTGGRSETLQNIMKDLRQNAMIELQVEAEKAGGNAVVGLSMDFDEYAEGMMMLSVYGTAVTITNS